MAQAWLYPMLLATGLCLGVSPAAAQTRKALVPGKVRVTGTAVTGSFRITASKRGLPSTGTGGACLVADLSRRACRTDEDCIDLRSAYHPDGWAYCLRPGLSLAPKTCWLRPGKQADYCRVSPSNPYPLDTDLALPVVAADPRQDGRPVRWLVHGCLNRLDRSSGKDHPGCKASDPRKRRIWNGTATTVHP